MVEGDGGRWWWKVMVEGINFWRILTIFQIIYLQRWPDFAIHLVILNEKKQLQRRQLRATCVYVTPTTRQYARHKTLGVDIKLAGGGRGLRWASTTRFNLCRTFSIYIYIFAWQSTRTEFIRVTCKNQCTNQMRHVCITVVYKGCVALSSMRQDIFLRFYHDLSTH